MSARQLAQVQTEALSTPVPGPELAATAAEVLSTPPVPGPELIALVQECVASVRPPSEIAQALVEALRGHAPASTAPQQAVFAFAHNWAEPLVERLEWQTSVARTASGLETRHSERSHPRRSITYRVGTGRASDALVADWLTEHLGRPAWWPLPQYAVRLRQPAAAGATALQVCSLPAQHYGPPDARLRLTHSGVQGWQGQERWALLLADDGWHALRIDSIAGTALHLRDALPVAAAAGSSVMPLLWGRASEPVHLTQHVPGVASASVQAQLDPAPTPDVAAHADALLDGIPVWPDGNWRDDPGATVAAAVTRHELSPAQPWLRRDDPWSLNTLQRRYLAASSAEIDAWRARLWRAQGRLRPFWLPDGLAPVLRLTHDFVAEDGWLSVAMPHVAAALWQRNAACLILLPNGQRRYALTGPMQAEFGGGATLTLRTPLQESIAAGSRVLRLQRCRLDHDAVDLHWHTPQQVEIALTARQLPETPHAAALMWPVALTAPTPLPTGIPLRAPPRPPQFQCPPPPRVMRRLILRSRPRSSTLDVLLPGAENWISHITNSYFWMPPDGVTEVFITACGAGGDGGLAGAGGITWPAWPDRSHFLVVGGAGGGGGGEGQAVIRQPLTVYPGRHVQCHLLGATDGTRISTNVPGHPFTGIVVEGGKRGERGKSAFMGADDPTPGGSINAQPGMPRVGAEGGRGGNGAPSPLAGTEFADASVATGGSGDSRSFISFSGRNTGVVGYPGERATMPGAGGGGAGGMRVDLNFDEPWREGRPAIAAETRLDGFQGIFFNAAHGHEMTSYLGSGPGGPALVVIEWHDPEPSP